MKVSLRLAAQRLAAEVIRHHSLEAASVLRDALLEHPELLGSAGRFDSGVRRTLQIRARDPAGAVTFSVPGRILMYNLTGNNPGDVWWQTAHAWRDVYAALRKRGLIPKLRADQTLFHTMNYSVAHFSGSYEYSGSHHFAEDVSITTNVTDRRRRGGIRREPRYLLTYWRLDPDTQHTHYLLRRD